MKESRWFARSTLDTRFNLIGILNANQMAYHDIFIELKHRSLELGAPVPHDIVIIVKEKLDANVS